MGWRVISITAPVVIIESGAPNTGLFVYNGTPSASNPPILSITTATKDPFGNTVLPGALVVYNPHGAVIYDVDPRNDGWFLYADTGTATQGALIASAASGTGTDRFGTAFQAGIVSYVAGTPSTYGQLFSANLAFSVAGLTSKAGISGGSNLNLFSGTTAALPVPGQITLMPVAAGTFGIAQFAAALQLINMTAPAPVIGELSLYASAGNLGIVKPSTFVLAMNSSPPADFTAFTVTAIVATQCTKAWSIPGNDAQVGTTYRLTFSGTGNQGTTTAEILEFQVSGFANAKISQTFAGINQPFDWKVVAEVTIITTGLTGTANFSVWCSAGGGDNNGYSHAGAFDTTNTFTLEGQALWGGNTGGGQTITCDQSFVERIGP